MNIWQPLRTYRREPSLSLRRSLEIMLSRVGHGKNWRSYFEIQAIYRSICKWGGRLGRCNVFDLSWACLTHEGREKKKGVDEWQRHFFATQFCFVYSLPRNVHTYIEGAFWCIVFFCKKYWFNVDMMFCFVSTCCWMYQGVAVSLTAKDSSFLWTHSNVLLSSIRNSIILFWVLKFLDKCTEGCQRT